MLCQKCGKATATTHIKTIVNGMLTEYDLCSACAKELGHMNLFQEMNFNLGSFLGGFIGTQPGKNATARCPKCGASFAEITESGKIGCAECYKFFYDKLLPTIHRIHGTAKHKGKIPGTYALSVPEPAGVMAVIEEKSPIERKRAQMQEAVEKQDFERAAQLRDEIHALENQDKKESEGTEHDS